MDHYLQSNRSMKYIDYNEVIKAGGDYQGLINFVKQNPDIQLRNAPEMPSGQDVVSPFLNENVVKTQDIGENPQWYGQGGHTGQDYAYIRDPNKGTPTDEETLRAAIGGLVLSGYQPGGFGNVSAVVGANPQELAQMSPEEKVRLQQEFAQRLPTAKSLQSFPELSKYGNVVLMGHGQDRLPSGTEIATGSALMKEGNTGWSTAPHVHAEAMKNGQAIPLNEFIKAMMYR